MSEEDKAMFRFDIMDIPMIEYCFLFCYGVHRWILKENGLNVPVDLSGHNLNTVFSDKLSF